MIVEWKFIIINFLSLSLFVLAVLVIAKNYKDNSYLFYGFFMIGASLWVFAIYGFYYDLIFKDKLIWLKITHSLGILIPFFLYLFLTRFYKEAIKHLDYILVVLVFIFLLFVLFTDLVITQAFNNKYGLGKLYLIYSGFIVFVFLLCYYILFKKQLIIKDYFKRLQSFMIFLGIFLSSLPALIVDLIFPYVGIFDYLWLGPLFTALAVIFIALAIFKYKLFNLSIIISEILVFLLWYFTFFQMFIFPSPRNFYINLLSFILAIILGIFLIRSVIVEFEQRERLKLLNKKLEELNKIKSEFLSFASHQIKSPMTNIKGFIDLISEGVYGDINDNIKEILVKIKNNIKEEIDLIDNLLDLRKIEEGRMEYNFSKFDILELIKEICDFYKIRALEKGLALNCNINDEKIFIEGDIEKLKQVFNNLVDNAIKYTNSGFVEISYKKLEDKLIVKIKDTGIGIKPELLKNLFGQFIRDPSVKRTIKGTGLGLFIAKEIVNAHKGKIWAESEGEGMGSIFYVELPIVKEDK